MYNDKPTMLQHEQSVGRKSCMIVGVNENSVFTLTADNVNVLCRLGAAETVSSFFLALFPY